MKTNNKSQSNPTPKSSFKETCHAFCKKLLAEITSAKEELFAEFKQRFGREEHLLRLALNEAEALAWETEYPHLFFPQLATEKAEAAAKWEARQEIVRAGHRLSQTMRAIRRIDEERKPVLAIA